MRSSTETLIDALQILSRDIQSDDGIANAAIAEAADRLSELNGAYQRYIGFLEAMHRRITFTALGISDRSLLYEIQKTVKDVLAVEQPLMQSIVAQNYAAAASTYPLTTLDYDETTGRFAVKCGGEYIECFATRKEAETFAIQHDKLTFTGSQHNAAQRTDAN